MAVGDPHIRPVQGIAPDRVPCFLEGLGLYPVWLTENEVRGGFQLFRPKRDPTPVPVWYRRKGAFRDVTLDMPDKPRWLAIEEIKYGWVRLTGMMEHMYTQTLYEKEDVRPKSGIVQPFCWGIQRYDTFFLPLSDAIPRTKPRMNKLSIWDHVDVGRFG